MDIDELEAISAVNLYGSYIDASRGSGTPISTLSKRVSRAEEELGLPIFDRKTSSNSVQLTEHGEALMPIIQKLLSANSSMLRTVEKMLGSGPPSLSVGRPSMLGNLGESSIVSSFLAKNPDVEFISVFRSHSELLRLLSEGLLECAFLFVIGGNDSVRDMWSTFAKDMYSIIMLKSSPDLFIGVSEHSPLASGDTVSVDQLRAYPFIFSKWMEFARQDKGQLPPFFEHMKLDSRDFKIIYEDFINRDYIYKLVAGGVGVLPQALEHPDNVPGVKFLRLEGWVRTSSILFVARKYGSPCLKKFAAFVADSAENQK